MDVLFASGPCVFERQDVQLSSVPDQAVSEALPVLILSQTSPCICMDAQVGHPAGAVNLLAELGNNLIFSASAEHQQTSPM